MPEINQNIEMWAGEDVVIYVDMGSIDIPSLSIIKWQLAETSDAEIPEVEKDLMNGIDIEYAENRLKVTLDSVDTINLGGNRYYQEIRVWDNVNNNQVTIALGRVKINPTTYSQVQGS